jgi:uncharacterized MAPEG superfamily protein
MTVPFVCVLIAFLQIYLTRIPVAMAMRRQPGGYDNNHGRDQQAQLTGWGRRALASHHNSIEAFPPFAAGVIICYLAKGSLSGATTLSLIFVAARMAYPLFYLADIAPARSLSWLAGVMAVLGLYILPWLS